MSIEFVWLDKKNGLESATLTESDFKRVEFAFDQLRDKTGIYVDPYSDTRISPDHSQLLLSSIKEDGAARAGELGVLEDMLRKAATESWWILAVGD